MKKDMHRPSGHACPFECRIVRLGGAQHKTGRRSSEQRPERIFRVPEIRSDKPDAAHFGTLGGLKPEDRVAGKADYT